MCKKRRKEKIKNEVCDGVRWKFDIEDDGGPQGERSKISRACLCSEGSMQEDQGNVELSNSTLWLLDVWAPQCSAQLGCSN